MAARSRARTAAPRWLGWVIAACFLAACGQAGASSAVAGDGLGPSRGPEATATLAPATRPAPSDVKSPIAPDGGPVPPPGRPTSAPAEPESAVVPSGRPAPAGPVAAVPSDPVPAGAGPATATASPATQPAHPGVRSPAVPTAGYQGAWGLYAPDFPGSLATISALQHEVGRSADYVMWYVHWAGPYSQLNVSDLAAVTANGSTPIITWMSDDPTGASTITDGAIAAGSYDAYIRSWAQGLRAYGRPVLLRLDHEMNGNWYGWAPGINGNTAASYIAAWRHVHDLFTEAGAKNVSFVWSPNVDYPGATPMAALYPGDAYVSLVGLDGYNWGPLDGHSWLTPAEVFGPSLDQIQAVTHRPLLISEVGSTSLGGDKAQWIQQFFSWLGSEPAVEGFVWFDADKETDWAIDSAPSCLTAFVEGLSG